MISASGKWLVIRRQMSPNQKKRKEYEKNTFDYCNTGAGRVDCVFQDL